MSMDTAYIINAEGHLVCEVKTKLKNGTQVRYAFKICKASIDASRKFNLVNAFNGQISRAKKWQKYEYDRNCTGLFAKEINQEEFYIMQIHEEFYTIHTGGY